MRLRYLTVMALSAALFLPTAASARDGAEARHWRAFPGAEFAVPQGWGHRFDLFIGAPRTGFALRGPTMAPAGRDGRLALMPVPEYPIEPAIPPTAPTGY